MLETIITLNALGYIVTIERFGYAQTLVGLEKFVKLKRVRREQLIPDDHFTEAYFKSVTDFIQTKF